MKVEDKIKNVNQFPDIKDCDGFVANDLIYLFLDNDDGLVVLYPNDMPSLISHGFRNWGEVFEEFGTVTPIEEFKITVERA